MKVATAAQMKELDNYTIHGLGVDSTVLMERAAQGIAHAVLGLLEKPEGARVVVFSGSGNNGGDGVCVARQLMERGLNVTALLVGKREKMTPDTLEMERRLYAAGGTLLDFDPADETALACIGKADVLVDAIFGIGLNSDIRGSVVEAIRLMNESDAPVVSADIPSGVESDTGRILGSAVNAAVTVTFTLPKTGHFVGKGGLCTGKLVIHDIGIPRELVNAMSTNVTAIDQDLVRSFLPKRPADGHKGTFGKVYILSGSVGYTGAPVLASRAAVRSGSGLVSLGVPKTVYPIVAVKSDEAMPNPLAEDETGKLSGDAFVPVLEKMAGCDAALIGPGLGRSKELTELICNILSTVKYPIVLDADGLNAVSEHIDTLYRRRDCPTIITPHDGEFRRLGGELSDGDRISAASRFAMIYGCLLVLKGHCTIIALPDGEVILNTTGNSGMAKGGSGDVLSGMILSLVGQGIHPVKAAVAAVWLHGRAGDLAAAEKGEYGMTPTDLLEQIPYALKEVTE